jgi:hypothetical protein
MPELGIRYFSPFSLFAIPLLVLHHLFSLWLLCYFLNIAIFYSLFTIATFDKISVEDRIILESSIAGKQIRI